MNGPSGAVCLQVTGRCFNVDRCPWRKDRPIRGGDEGNEGWGIDRRGRGSKNLHSCERERASGGIACATFITDFEAPGTGRVFAPVADRHEFPIGVVVVRVAAHLGQTADRAGRRGERDLEVSPGGMGDAYRNRNMLHAKVVLGRNIEFARDTGRVDVGNCHA